jgi:hypothetical protein
VSRSLKPDSFRGARTEGGVVIEFGDSVRAMPAAGAAPEAEAFVRVDDRIELPVSAARRLLASLEQAVRRGRGGPVAEESAPAQLAATPDLDLAPGATLRGRTPVNAPMDPDAAHAARLMRLVDELGVPHQHERSMRLSRGELLSHRFLLTMNRADLGDDALGKTLGICRELRMPAAAEFEAAARFDEAVCVHFGFEASPKGSVCKLYLERPMVPAEKDAAAAAGRSVLVHTAFKWSPGAGTHVLARYLWRPEPTLPQVRARIAELLGGESTRAAQLAFDVLALGLERAPLDRLQLLEASEEGSPRRSFDLNLYAAEREMQDAQATLYAMRDHFGVPPGRFQAIYDQVRHQRLGHVAGGVHRDGSEFLTVYFGVQVSTRFASGLGSR